MAFTDQEIKDYALKLEAKGASANEIEAFVSGAKSEHPAIDSPVKQMPMSASDFTMALKNAKTDTEKRAIVAAQGTPSGTAPDKLGSLVGELSFGPKLAVKWLLGHGGEAGDMALRAAGPAIGQRIAGPPGKFIGGVAGDAAAQINAISGGRQQQFQPGQLVGAGIAQFGSKGVGQPSPAGLMKNAATYGGANLAGQAVATGIDEKRALTFNEASNAAGAGALSAVSEAGFDKGKLAKKGIEAAGNNLPKINAYNAGLREGFVVDPALSNPTASNRSVSGLTGTQAIRDRASVINQTVANRVVRADLGIPEGTPLDSVNYKMKRFEEAQPYREFASLSPSAKEVLDAWIKTRDEARAAWKDYARNATKTARDEATKLDLKASEIEDFMHDGAKQLGRPDLVAQMNVAKVNLAKLHAAESATLKNGDISASVLGAMRENDAPLTGGLKTVADMYVVQPQVMRDARAIGSASKTIPEMFRSAIGTGYVLSNPNQRISALPNFGQNAVTLPVGFARFATAAAGRTGNTFLQPVPQSTDQTQNNPFLQR